MSGLDGGRDEWHDAVLRAHGVGMGFGVWGLGFRV